MCIKSQRHYSEKSIRDAISKSITQHIEGRESCITDGGIGSTLWHK